MQKLMLAAVAAAFALSLAGVAPASAAVIIITQQKAIDGTVTPNDQPGFPVTLSVPGAYRLDTNLNVTANKIGLHVTTNYVDIDMNGFRLWGWQGNSLTRLGLVGVQSSFGISRIRNGYITGFKSDGIRLVGIGASSWVVEDMQIFGNAGKGIQAADSNYHRFSRNSVLRNADDGIYCGAFCRIDESAVSDNGGEGIACGDACHVEGNVLAGNDANGIVIVSGTVLGNTISGNHLRGIDNQGSAADHVGFGNNTLIDNNSGGAQIGSRVLPLEPNHCFPVAC